MFHDNSILVASWPRENDVAENWGDKLNPVIIRELSERPIVHEGLVLGWGDRPVFRVIGSGLGAAKSNHVIWGMGFIDNDVKPREKPAAVYAVRGPMSRRKLLESDIACPETYGDPAILYPLFYYPHVQKLHKYGFVQHFRERGLIPAPIIPGSDSIFEIDVTSGIKEFVQGVLSCEIIISSSLHGIICAHSYGIPAYWLKSSDLPLGDDFKFHDYYASIGHPVVVPSVVNAAGEFVTGSIPTLPEDQLIFLEELIGSCPFLERTRKRALIRKAERLRDNGAVGIIFNQYSRQR